MGKGPAGPRRAPSPPVDGAPPQPPPRSARDRALALLATRWRSRDELRGRLRRAGFDAEEVDATLADLERAGLVDDARFARQVVGDRALRRLDGARRVRAVLREHGVEGDVADEALREAGDDADRARELASQRAARLAGLSPQSAYRRVLGLLVRRGYAFDTAAEAAREALAGRLDDEPDTSGA